MDRLIRRAVIVLVVACGFAAAVDAGPFGINGHIAEADLMDEAFELGVSWMRIDFIWLLVETEQDVFDWTIYDRLIADAEARGFQVYAGLGATPLWATDGTEARGRPRSEQDWWDFCYRAAARYRGRVAAWGLWNEPNLSRFWEGSQLEYIEEILLPGAAAVRAADPSALVVGPDLAHLSSGSWDDWLRSCLWYAGDVLDVVAHHVYPSGTSAGSVLEKLNDDGQYPWDPPSVRSVLDDSDWTNRPFWLTETGLESDEAGQDAQSDFYRDLLNALYPSTGAKNWVDRVFFYELADPRADLGLSWGVLGPLPDLLRKQAFMVYQAFVQDAEITDGAVVGVHTEALYLPNEQGALSVVVRNDGTTAWHADDGIGISVDGLPGSWDREDVAVVPATPVQPGETFRVVTRLIAPDRNPEWPNRIHNIVVRLHLADGKGFGLPGRAAIVTGTRPAPVFLEHPVDAAAREGYQASFSVTADGGAPIVYQWQLNGRNLADGPSFAGTDTAMLTVVDVDRHVAGEYRCAVFSPNTHQVYSNTAVLDLLPEDDGGPREGDGRAGAAPPRDIRFDDVFPPEARLPVVAPDAIRSR
jgi:hypothetical protein